jgi:O-antigen/teichoic acid export membrane protein
MKDIRKKHFSNLNTNNKKESLFERVIRGGFWVFALRFTNRGFGFIRKIVLARLLAPEDFGLLGIAFLSISTLETFSQTGFQAALVRKNADIKPYLDTAWTVSAIRGVILFSLLFLSAPFVAKSFSSPQAISIIRVIGVTVLLSGFTNIGIIFYQKELEFKKQFFYQLSGTLTNFGVAIFLAFTLRNVWALVWGGLTASFVQLVMSYIVHPYRPRLRFEKAKFEELFSFGKWLLGQSIVIFLITQGDDIFVGKMFGVTALGFYQMAYLISNLCATEITHVISGVTFPAYAKMQDDLERMKQACLRVLRLTCIISFPLATGIFILAPILTQVILTEKWMPMVSSLQVMCGFGVMRSIAATFGPVYRALGRPDIPLRMNITHLLFLCLIIYPLGIKWQLFGVAVGITIAMVVALLITSTKIISLLEMNFADLLKPIIIPFVASGVAALTVLCSIQFVKCSNLNSLFFLMAVGLAVYCILSWVSHRVLKSDGIRILNFIK